MTRECARMGEEWTVVEGWLTLSCVTLVHMAGGLGSWAAGLEPRRLAGL